MIGSFQPHGTKLVKHEYTDLAKGKEGKIYHTSS